MADIDAHTPAITAIIDVYRQRLADAFRDSSAESTAQIEEEVRKLKDDIANKRREVEAFRQKHNIVSLEREENEDVVTAFLARAPEFRVAPAAECPAEARDRIDSDGFLRCLPHVHDTDGFFAARLVRRP